MSNNIFRNLTVIHRLVWNINLYQKNNFFLAIPTFSIIKVENNKKNKKNKYMIYMVYMIKVFAAFTKWIT